MRVFVTGGSGFLGHAIVSDLLARGHECAVLMRRPLVDTRLAPFAANVTTIDGDLFAPETYCAALMSYAPHALVHSAWRGADGASYDDIAQFENVAATAHLVEASIAAGATIVIGVGSQVEYGPKADIMRESDAAQPTTLYGVAKLAACLTLLSCCGARGARGAWGRIFSIYGPGDDNRRFLSMLIHAFREKRAPDLTGCEQIWDFLHVDDAAAAIVSLLETRTAQGVFNIGSGAPSSLRDVVIKLRDRLAPGVEPGFGRIPYRHDQVMRLQADISRLRAVTGWEPRLSLDEGMDLTLAAYAQRRAVA